MRVGLGYHPELSLDAPEVQSRLDCVEITADEFFNSTPSQRTPLVRIREAVTVLVHGLELSIGSVTRPPQSYLDSVARVLEFTNPPYFSEHLAICSTANVNLGVFAPVWHTEDNLAVVASNVDRVQRFLGLPLVLETITKPFDIPGATMSETEFISRLCADTGCGILLDLTNVYINCRNLGGSYTDFAHHLPHDRIREIHLVGYGDNGDRLVDDHAHSIQPELWQLYDFALSMCTPQYVIIERDANFPPINELLGEVARARRASRASSPGA